MTSLSSTMFGNARQAAKQALFNVGYYHQRLAQSEFAGVAILCYHGLRSRTDPPAPFNDLHVDLDVFDAHCRFIATACDPISLDDFRAALDGRRALPPRPVIVTFDDGYRSVLEHGLPTLERHGIPAAVFVCIEPVLRSQHFWFDTLCRQEDEEAVLRAAAMPYREWRRQKESMAAGCYEHEKHRPLTVRELRQLASSPLIEIGGHTLSHPALARASVEEQRCEIAGCRTALEDAIGKRVNAFAYPFGQTGVHYTAETAGRVREAGFDLAFSTQPSLARTDDGSFDVPRFVVLDAVTDVELAHRLTHSWNLSHAGV
jgi:peptidoglycan/xylan/chitin deacetylase (PgdA/CDA1 family)